MVYLLKMVIFHGYVSHNQMVSVTSHPNPTIPRQYWVSIQSELQRWQLRGEVVGHLERTEVELAGPFFSGQTNAATPPKKKYGVGRIRLK
jgi:hypothetical protein